MSPAGIRAGLLAAAASAWWALGPAASQSPQAQSQPQRPIFREGVNLVVVDVYPRREGRIVEGLTREDFEVFENGAPQVIDSVEFIRVEPSPVDAVRRDPSGQREMLLAAGDPRNRVFVAFLDTLHTSSFGSHAIRRPLLDTVNRLIRPNDLFGLITQNERASELVLGRVLHSLEDQLRRHWAWGERHRLVDIANGVLSGLDEHDPMESRLDACFSNKVTASGIFPWYIDDGPTTRLYSEVLIERRREDRVISALEKLVAYLGDIRNARTVLMIVSDGWLWFPVDRPLAEHMMDSEATAPAKPNLHILPGGRLSTTPPDWVNDRKDCQQELVRLANLDNPRRLQTLVEDARQRSVSIYPINPEGLGTDNLPADYRTRANRSAGPGDLAERYRERVHQRIEGLRTLAEGTDAFAVVDTNDIASGLERIADDLSAYYLIGYVSANPEPDGRYRTIRVNVKQPGLEVRARRGYRAATVAPAGPAGDAAGIDAAAEALEAAFGALSRTRTDAPVHTYGVAAAGEVALVVELTPAQALAARVETSVHVEVMGADGAVAGAAEGAIQPGSRGVIVRVALPDGSSGPWRANVTAGSGRDRRQDSVAIATNSRALAGPPVVYRATPSPRSPLMPVADFRFRRTERVHVEWTRLSDIDRREARLLGRDGRPLAVPVNLTEREAGGRASIAADVNLAPLTDGEYAIELTVGSGDRVERQVVAIRVTR
jgi:VWFA-related protein